MTTMTKEQEFVRDFRALLEKYQVTVEIDTGYYGRKKDVGFCIGEKRVARLDAWRGPDWGDQRLGWTFDV